MSLRSHALVVLTVCIGIAGVAQADVITFRSGDGNGAAGTPDPNVTVLERPMYNQQFLTPGDFLAAQVIPATIVETLNPYWAPTLDADSDARWISTQAHVGQTTEDMVSGLYAIKIINPSNSAVTATLDLYYMVDNYLGSRWYPGNETAMVYLNDEPIVTYVQQAANEMYRYQQELHLTGLTLTPGDNWLYINATNSGLAAGVIFSGTMTTRPVDVPEPMTMSLLAVGAVGLFLRRKR